MNQSTENVEVTSYVSEATGREITQAEAEFITVFDMMQESHHGDMIDKGFWPEGKERNIGESIMLIVTELAEGFEDYRNDMSCSLKIPDFTPLEEEFADVILRIMDLAGGTGLRIAEALVAKKRHNLTRAHKHGKKF